MNVQVPGTDQARSFSFSSGPGADEVGFLIRNTTYGVLTTYLRERAKTGDKISFNGPLGSFYLRKIERPVLFLAGGTGLAPFLSMLHKIEQDGASEHPIHLIFGVTNDADLVEVEKLEGYASRMSNFTFTCVVAAEESSYPNKGFVTHHMKPEHLHDGFVDVYLCGPPPMVDAVRKYLADQGIEPASFYYEKFSGSGVVSEIGESHVKAVDSDEAFDTRMALELGAAQLIVGRLSAEQLAEYRRLAEATGQFIKDGHFTDPAGFREANSAFHLFPIEATANEVLLEAYRKLLVQEYMGQVLTPSVDVVGDITQDHIQIVDAFESGDFEALRRIISSITPTTPRRRCGRGSRSRGARVEMIFPARFDGKTLVVTGAAQGLGEAVATRAAREGGRSPWWTAPRTCTRSPRSSRRGRADCAFTADLEQYRDGATVMAAARKRGCGRIDILINNVGGAINFKPYVEFTEEQIVAEIRRSLFPTLWCCRAVLPFMVERRQGTIVNVSSAAARGIHRIPYSAAKGGVNALTASLAWEYADHGIRVVATAPGGIEAPPRKVSRGTPQPQSDQEKAWFQAHIDQTLTSSLMHRYGTLDEEVAPILFLASDEASYITGTRLPVAGGDPG